MAFRIYIKDNGSIDEMEKHFEDFCDFIMNKGLSGCKTRCNMGCVLGHFTVETDNLFSMGVILQNYANEIEKIEPIQE